MHEEKVKQKKITDPNRTGIPDGLRKRVEEKSGLSMEDVRVHYHSSQPASVGALAFTMGNDVHIAQGQEKHLPHELGHVVQQREGRVRATTVENGFAVNDDPVLEKEADHYL